MGTAIITGASRGLGLALTRALAESGWRLVVDARDGERWREADAGPRRRRRRRRATSPIRATGPRSSPPPATRSTSLVNNASALGPSPLPPLAEYSPGGAAPRLRGQRARAARARPGGAAAPARGAAIIDVSSDAAVEPYEGWGGYGSSKAALDQLTAILAAEHPALRVYAVDPGDMRTQMHQDAFPGEDISDRPPPEESVPGLLALVEGSLPSGRYRARELTRERA